MSIRPIILTALLVAIAPQFVLAQASQQPANQFVSSIAKMIVIDALPDAYLDEKRWGATHPFTEGVKFRGQLNSLRIERRRVERNHGTWKRYKADIENPEEDIQLEVQNLRFQDNETWMTIVAVVKLNAEAELQQWTRGAKLIGVSVVASSKIRITMDCKVSTSLQSISLIGLLTSAQIVPEVLETDLELIDFRLHRIGFADGPVVRELGKQLRGRVREELEKQQPKLTKSANKAIQKELDKGQLHQRLIQSVRDSFAKNK
ncbi:MAG: hypothetical protein COA78_22630 [Blastopirellula sp.]|nr:MAG: hypothetical protein COA78_22630 [Blastopirellula sp.]